MARPAGATRWSRPDELGDLSSSISNCATRLQARRIQARSPARQAGLPEHDRLHRHRLRDRLKKGRKNSPSAALYRASAAAGPALRTGAGSRAGPAGRGATRRREDGLSGETRWARRRPLARQCDGALDSQASAEALRRAPRAWRQPASRVRRQPATAPASQGRQRSANLPIPRNCLCAHNEFTDD